MPVDINSAVFYFSVFAYFLGVFLLRPVTGIESWGVGWGLKHCHHPPPPIQISSLALSLFLSLLSLSLSPSLPPPSLSLSNGIRSAYHPNKLLQPSYEVNASLVFQVLPKLLYQKVNRLSSLSELCDDSLIVV